MISLTTSHVATQKSASIKCYTRSFSLNFENTHSPRLVSRGQTLPGHARLVGSLDYGRPQTNRQNSRGARWQGPAAVGTLE